MSPARKKKTAIRQGDHLPKEFGRNRFVRANRFVRQRSRSFYREEGIFFNEKMWQGTFFLPGPSLRAGSISEPMPGP